MKVPTPLEEEEPGRTMVSLSRNLPSSLTRPVGSEPCWWCQTETAAWLPWLTMQSCYPWRGPCRWPPSALHSPASVVKKKEITLESPLNWPGKGQDGNLLGSDILTHPEGLRNFQPRLKVASPQTFLAPRSFCFEGYYQILPLGIGGGF